MAPVAQWPAHCVRRPETASRLPALSSGYIHHLVSCLGIRSLSLSRPLFPPSDSQLDWFMEFGAVGHIGPHLEGLECQESGDGRGMRTKGPRLSRPWSSRRCVEPREAGLLHLGDQYTGRQPTLPSLARFWGSSCHSQPNSFSLNGGGTWNALGLSNSCAYWRSSGVK